MRNVARPAIRGLLVNTFEAVYRTDTSVTVSERDSTFLRVVINNRFGVFWALAKKKKGMEHE